MAHSGPFTFTSDIWQWDARRSDGWYFTSLPEELADDIDAAFGHRAAGFGSVKVEVTIGRTTWQTSIFPDSKRGTYVLPLKKAVRTMERLSVGQETTVALRVIA